MPNRYYAKIAKLPPQINNRIIEIAHHFYTCFGESFKVFNNRSANLAPVRLV
jgi:hypothetical protein